MNISGKSIQQIVDENNLSKEQTEWLERVKSIMNTYQKHVLLNTKTKDVLN